MELYQRHDGIAAEACARCGRPTPCAVRAFAATVIAAAGEDPRWYGSGRALPAPAGPVAGQARQPDPIPATEQDRGRAQPEYGGYAVGGRSAPLDAEDLLYEREH
ncbi:hypothetical protein [Micromonospora chalcea]|uniref:hypothetical protein n=1 Tax=Micromonospora chalcea TaxID=1874 RepID=UPI0011B09BE2|nr:hypothetical protein [Micromonospora chalcea]